MIWNASAKCRNYKDAVYKEFLLSCLLGAGIGLQGNPGRGINAGLQKRALQGTSMVVRKTLRVKRRGRQTPLKGGEGKFEGEGGFSGTLPPLQGKFVVSRLEF